MDFGAFVMCGIFLLCSVGSGFAMLITRPISKRLRQFFVVSGSLFLFSCLYIYKVYGLDEALACTTETYRTEEALRLLDCGADPNARTELGMTALLGAIGNDNAELVNALIAKGADVNKEGRIWSEGGKIVDSTPLKAALKKKNPQIVQMLRDAGAH